MGLLSGLGDLGLGKIEGSNIYEEEKAAEAAAPKQAKPVEKPFDENEWLLDKTCECPVCGQNFTNRTVKTAKAKLVGTDPDLRPRYDKIDPLKYDVIMCSQCGYAGVGAKYFAAITPGQAKLVKTAIAGKVRGVSHSGIFTYDNAIKRYQIALACAITKKAKNSERAFTCLKMAWTVRGKRETYDINAEDYEEVMAYCRETEDEALKMAYEGFIKARQEESFPIAGMDEHTLDFLIADMAVRFGNYDIAAKLISGILTNPHISERVKSKARDLKERIQFELKNRQ